MVSTENRRDIEDILGISYTKLLVHDVSKKERNFFLIAHES